MKLRRSVFMPDGFKEALGASQHMQLAVLFQSVHGLTASSEDRIWSSHQTSDSASCISRIH